MSHRAQLIPPFAVSPTSLRTLSHRSPGLSRRHGAVFKVSSSSVYPQCGIRMRWHSLADGGGGGGGGGGATIGVTSRQAANNGGGVRAAGRDVQCHARAGPALTGGSSVHHQLGSNRAPALRSLHWRARRRRVGYGCGHALGIASRHRHASSSHTPRPSILPRCAAPFRVTLPAVASSLRGLPGASDPQAGHTRTNL